MDQSKPCTKPIGKKKSPQVPPKPQPLKNLGPKAIKGHRHLASP
ncbi:hypothetical protein EBI_26304 [Enterocytozoon bieneusi H348]|nr:hypothetical protein EBI_26304 [Enterocytozoon bieneusi H348]|eukprot:XP_002651061.1 hypothetical protein EBI_26304 [Enterocytozoon bieneusi H348]